MVIFPVCCKATLRMSYLFAYFLLALALCSNASQEPNWGPCPPGQQQTQYKMDCANMTYPLDYTNHSLGNVTAFIRRQYVNNVTNSSVWTVAGGPGDSTIGFIPLCQVSVHSQWFLSISRSYVSSISLCQYFIGLTPSFTCYSQGYSSFPFCSSYSQSAFNIYTPPTPLIFSSKMHAGQDSAHI